MGEGELPVDLLIEILHRLPAKSLLRFQSVSKSWPPLIRDPNFIARHLRAPSGSKSATTIIQSEHGNFQFSRMDTPQSLLSFRCIRSFTVIGSSNGFLCLLFQGCRVIISNMLIKDHHMTSIPAKFCDSGGSTNVPGFGYDSINDDYKVVLVKTRYVERNSVETTIYSLRSNAWSKGRRWDAFGQRAEFVSSYYFLGCANGVVASCGLHWLGRARANDNDNEFVLLGLNCFGCFIIGFHLNREEFFELSLPDQVSKSRGGVDCDIRIGVLDRCLCISSVASPEQPYHDIWVVKEYGIRASWTKLFRFETKVEESISMSLTPLLHFPKEDQVLLFEERRHLFYLYDIRDQQQSECVSNDVEPNVNRSLYHGEAVCLSTIVSLADYRAHWKQNMRWNERLRKKRKIDDYSSSCLKAFDCFRYQFDLFIGMSRNA